MTGAPQRHASALVVDDEDSVRKFVERVLQEAGYTTSEAAHGPEAIDLASKLERSDILLTDLMMPQLTGDELARRLRLAHPSLKILSLTGFSDRALTAKVPL